jgi:beta-lactamase superfamily II metal-dependent hydrolase
MKLKSYPAGKGDSFLVTWNDAENSFHLLVDSGIPRTYGFIRPDLVATGKLDAVILTHVDYDHLGGYLKLVDDEHLELSSSYPVYMNTPSLVLTLPEGDEVSLDHGVKLEEKLRQRGIVCQSLYSGMSDSNVLNIKGLQIQVITPSKMVIDELLKEWTANKLYLKYKKEQEGDDKVGRDLGKLSSYEEILLSPEFVYPWDDDLINSSSISFIASYAERAVLFLGDANPELVADELEHLGFSEKKKLIVNYVKLSHHGSKHNSTKRLLSMIGCHKYIISTNGAGPNYHPDRETFVRLAEYGRNDKSQSLQIYLNYDLDMGGVVSAEEAIEWNIEFVHQEIFEL